MTPTKVADLTVEELKILIQNVIRRTLQEALEDPDKGLELRTEIQQEIQAFQEYVASGGGRAPASEVAARLGLDW